MALAASVPGRLPEWDTIVWDMTRECGLDCGYCVRPPSVQSTGCELTTQEGHQLIRQMASAGFRQLILSVGHPALREDWLGLADEAHARGMAVTVHATLAGPVPRDIWRRARRTGIRSVALGLDSVRMKLHDAWHGHRGVHLQTIRALYALGDMGLPVEIHTVIMRDNMDELEGVWDIARMFGAVGWHLHLLIPTPLTLPALPDAREVDQVLRQIILMADQDSLPISVWEAPQIRRTLQMAGVVDTTAEGVGADIHIRRGRMLYVSPEGDVRPHEAIPVTLGNVRRQSLASFAAHGWLAKLHDPDALHGACGRCPLRRICGGSRARSYIMTGDVWATDPACPYAASL